MTPSRAVAVTGVLVATLVVGGCSFSGNASSPAGPTPRASTTPSTADPSTTTPPATSSAPTTLATTPTPTPSPSAPTAQQSPVGPPPGTAAGPAGSDDTDPGRCATADLSVSVAGGQGAAGSLYASVVLENAGSSACTLYGYPGVSYVAGPDGHQVGAAASRGSDGTGPSPRRVTLQPGDVAHATLRIVRYQAYPSERCQPAPVDGYRVYPPGSQAAAFVRQGGTTCSSQELGVLSVQPVVPGPPA